MTGSSSSSGSVIVCVQIEQRDRAAKVRRSSCVVAVVGGAEQSSSEAGRATMETVAGLGGQLYGVRGKRQNEANPRPLPGEED